MKEKCKMQTAFPGAAAASTQYHPLFACGWWWLRGKHKDHTHSAHILLFSSPVQMDVLTFSAQSSLTLFIVVQSQWHYSCMIQINRTICLMCHITNTFPVAVLVTCTVFVLPTQVLKAPRALRDTNSVFWSNKKQNYWYETFQSTVQTIQGSLCLAKRGALGPDQTIMRFLSGWIWFTDQIH